MPLDDAAAAAADDVADGIRTKLFELLRDGGPGAVIGAAPAGGGKTTFVIATVRALLDRGARVGIVTPTNEQGRDLVRKLTGTGVPVVRLSGAAALWSDDDTASWERPELLRQYTKGADVAALRPVVTVSTTEKLADAVMRLKEDDGEITLDVLVVDEAYQVKSASYLCVAGTSDVHLLVGDPGQLDPFTTATGGDYWRGMDTDPLATAVAVLESYQNTVPQRFALTRRLDERGARLAASFYPDIELRAWALTGHRSMSYSGSSRKLAEAADRGYSYVRFPNDGSEQPEPAIARKLAELAAELVSSGTTVCDEPGAAHEPLVPDRVLIGVSNNRQRILVQRELRSLGCGGIRVLTANKAQGLEFDVTLVWHPLAAQPRATDFLLDTGRLCVLLTRHRHAAVVVGCVGDDALVHGPPPPSAAYRGVKDPVLDGWYAHRRIFNLLLDRS